MDKQDKIIEQLARANTTLEKLLAVITAKPTKRELVRKALTIIAEIVTISGLIFALNSL